MIAGKSYRFLHADRTLSHGGGIALFYKTKFKAALLFQQMTVHAELMGVLLKINQTEFFIFIGYRPPSGSFNSFIEDVGDLLAKYCAKYDTFFVLGDFNIPFNKDDWNQCSKNLDWRTRFLSPL